MWHKATPQLLYFIILYSLNVQSDTDSLFHSDIRPIISQ
nr:MAG TPA: hypothetical protein [Caudoviricetes sp.]